MKDRALDAISEYSMLPHGSAVIVGVSGGADSMALIHFLVSLREQRKLNVIAAHVNHCLRGEDADNDELFVKNWCDSNNVEFNLLKADVKAKSKEIGCGVEECGRNIRYDFFESLADKYNAKIATAHTLSDDVETVLLNLTRGSSMRGLCGIPPVRGRIIRPLIYATRDDIEKYCYGNGITFVTDKSNFSEEYSRNKIRLNVIPILKKINVSLENSVLRATKQLQKSQDYIDEISEKEMKSLLLPKDERFLELYNKDLYMYDSNKLANLHEAIRSNIIFKAISKVSKVFPEASHINSISANVIKGYGTITVPGGLKVAVNKGILKVNNEKDGDILWENKFNATTILTEARRTFIIEVLDIGDYKFKLKSDESLKRHAVDYDCISSKTILRNRRGSDVFYPAGRGLSKTLKKFFNEEKVPVEFRESLAILVDSGNILWIEGFGAAEFSKVNCNTKKVVLIFSKGCS